MSNVSVVIICKNAESTIKQVLEKACMCSNDVVVMDSFSTDDTKKIAAEFPITWVEQTWLGYSAQKNKANEHAKYSWVLSIDTDEVLSEALIEELKSLSFEKGSVYSIPFENIYCGKKIRFGRWQGERHIRLFNKEEVQWNEDAVHEGLNIQNQAILYLKHPILHYSMQTKEEHLNKAEKYAMLGAERLKIQGKKATFIKRFINPPFRFFKDYVLSLGFLDGKLGFQIATIQAKEVFWKYKKLKELQQ